MPYHPNSPLQYSQCVDCGGRCDRKAKRCQPCHNRHIVRSGSEHPAWKGGRNLAPSGYIRIRDRGHPNAHADGLILEHRWLASKMLGRPLRDGEQVHHRNGDKTDNRFINLSIVSNAQHGRLHAKKRGSLSEQQIADLVLSGLPLSRIVKEHHVTPKRVTYVRQQILGLRPYEHVVPK